MIKCEINEKEDKVHIAVEGNIVECTKDLSILIKGLLQSGMKLECPVAALVSAVKDKMDQDDYNQTCTVISDLLKVIRDN